MGAQQNRLIETVLLSTWLNNKKVNKNFHRKIVNINKNFHRKIVNIFLPIIFSICFGCPKEPSHCNGSFAYSHYMFWLKNKKVIFLLHTLKDIFSCPIEIINGLTVKGQFQYLTKLKGLGIKRGLTCIQHNFFH